MKIYPSKANIVAVGNEQRKIADQNICISDKCDSEPFTFVLKKYSAICIFRLVTDNKFKSERLARCYQLSLSFFDTDKKTGKNYIVPFKHGAADKIIRQIFQKDTQNIWEHAPFTTVGVSKFTHHFYLFVSIPFGKQTIALKQEDMKELLANKYVMYE